MIKQYLNMTYNRIVKKQVFYKHKDIFPRYFNAEEFTFPLNCKQSTYVKICSRIEINLLLSTY